jgi:hypothetical protein
MKANNKIMLADIQAKAEADRQAYRKDLKEIKSGQAELRSIFTVWLTDIKNDRKGTKSCQEKMEARLEEEEPASVDMAPEVAQEQEVPLEDAVEIPVGKPRKRRRDRRYLTAVHR